MWEKLRGTMWNPPAAAAEDPARRRTYVFALEQAEQMFRAAAGTGSLEDRLGYLQAMTRPYDGCWWLFPAARAAGRSLHPLMAWWAVLYTLSMLARYQPAEWAAHIDIDASRHAVAIESLLKRAMSVDPP